MKVVFTPRDGERREWPLVLDDVEMVDASFIKKQTGLTHAAWKQALLEQDADALHGLLWVLLKQENPLYRWTDVRFRMSDVTFGFDADEVEIIVKRLASMSPDEAASDDAAAVRQMLAAQGVDVDAAIAELVADPEFTPEPGTDSAEVEQDPKA